MAEPGGIPQAGWLGIIGAIIALTGGPKAIGAAATWLADRAERRRISRAAGNAEWEGKLKSWDVELAGRERDLAQKLSEGLAECERHCEAARREMEAMRDDHRIVVLVVKVALPKLVAVAADSPEMQVIRTLLATRYPVDPETPDDLTELVKLLDQTTA